MKISRKLMILSDKHCGLCCIGEAWLAQSMHWTSQFRGSSVAKLSLEHFMPGIE